jgi:hypothetical protein
MTTQTSGQSAPVDRLVIPPEVLDLVRFLCQTWSEIDLWAHRDAGEAIISYPVIQGTRNQLNLTAIGEQKYHSDRVSTAVQWMIENAG